MHTGLRRVSDGAGLYALSLGKLFYTNDTISANGFLVIAGTVTSAAG
jgi:hypothetical protein